MNFCESFKHLNDDKHVFEEITYNDLRDMFDDFKTGIVLIGGPWSARTQAVISEANQILKREKIESVGFYNPKTLNVFKEVEDLRDCLSLESKLDYYYLIEKLKYRNKNDTLVENTLIEKMYVPTFIAIKNGECSDYFSANYVKDMYLHKPDMIDDRTMEFDLRLTELINSIKED